MNPSDARKTFYMVPNDGMGVGDADLRHQPFRTLLEQLDEQDLLPAAIGFYTLGVKLVAEGSPALEVLASLEAKGVRLLACKACVVKLRLEDRMRVGRICGMDAILAEIQRAEKVVTL